MKGSGPGSGAADSALWVLLVTKAQTRAVMRCCDLGSTLILEIWPWVRPCPSGLGFLRAEQGLCCPFLHLFLALGTYLQSGFSLPLLTSVGTCS